MSASGEVTEDIILVIAAWVGSMYLTHHILGLAFDQLKIRPLLTLVSLLCIVTELPISS